MDDTQAIKTRIRKWRDNAIDNARHHNNLAESFAKAGQADLARIYNRRACKYLAQIAAYEDVLKLL